MDNSIDDYCYEEEQETHEEQEDLYENSESISDELSDSYDVTLVTSDNVYLLRSSDVKITLTMSDKSIDKVKVS